MNRAVYNNILMDKRGAILFGFYASKIHLA